MFVPPRIILASSESGRCFRAFLLGFLALLPLVLSLSGCGSELLLLLLLAWEQRIYLNRYLKLQFKDK
jgi:hypothetical protein